MNNKIKKLYNYLIKNNFNKEASFLNVIASKGTIHSITGDDLIDPEEWRKMQINIERSEFSNLSTEDQEKESDFYSEKIQNLEEASHDEIIQMQMEDNEMAKVLQPLMSGHVPSAENNYQRRKIAGETDADHYILQKSNPKNIKRLAEVLDIEHNIDNPGAYMSEVGEADNFLEELHIDEEILLKGLSRLPIDLFASLFLSKKLKTSQKGFVLDSYDFWESGFKDAMRDSISISPRNLESGQVIACKELIEVLEKDKKYNEFLVELKDVCSSFSQDELSEDEYSEFDFSDEDML